MPDQLAREVAALTAKFETWAGAHDERLKAIEENQRLANNEVHNIMTELTVVQSRCIDRGKRISEEADRLDTLENRLRVQEDTGVHNVGEREGKKAVRRTALLAIAIVGAVGSICGIVLAVIKVAAMTGCGG